MSWIMIAALVYIAAKILDQTITREFENAQADLEADHENRVWELENEIEDLEDELGRRGG